MSTKKKNNKIKGLVDNRKALEWAVDYDYLAKLSPSEFAWLKRFTHGHYDNGEAGERRIANYQNANDLATIGERAEELPELSRASPEDAILEGIDLDRARERARITSPVRPRESPRKPKARK